MVSFDYLLEKKRGSCLPDRLLCLDPGGTTGWALFVGGKLDLQGQIPGYVHKTGDIDWKSLHELLDSTKPSHIICENYRVYAEKLEQHTFSNIPTLQIIGAVKYWSWMNFVSMDLQMALTAKQFATDDKLKQWGYWIKGQRHSRDAIRHGLYYLLFNKQYK